MGLSSLNFFIWCPWSKTGLKLYNEKVVTDSQKFFSITGNTFQGNINPFNLFEGIVSLLLNLSRIIKGDLETRTLN